MFEKSLLYFASSAIALVALATPAVAGSFNFSEKITAFDGATGDRFGKSVAIEGNVALIGASEDDGGSAYLFDIPTGNLLHKLTPPDGATGDRFGHSVAIEGNLALIGASEDDGGSAYLFDIPTGNLLHKLTPPDGATGHYFGWSVELDGDLALISGIDINVPYYESSSTYLFDTTTGNLLHTLITPRNGIYKSIAMDEGLALIGSTEDNNRRGSASLFDTATGDLLQKLTAPDDSTVMGFGASVAIDGDLALIRANETDNRKSVVYMFDLTNGNILHTLSSPSNADSDLYSSALFGFSLALDGNLALINSIETFNSIEEFNRSVVYSTYLFDMTTGNLLQKLTTPDGDRYDYFDRALAIDGDLALISAGGADSTAGAAYLFRTTTPQSNSIPEPTSILGLLAVSGLGISSLLKRKKD
ncbi:MAG: PEP-CTERM sorting domain-containing protein [Cyanobacteria bacterium SBLK]|nr:PEP-CTERM sorting domain-containing protein [Cyanobacteria bacterium SBLK]